jgi:hypothetical protein
MIASLMGGFAFSLALASWGVLSDSVAGAAAMIAGHGSLLASAIAWSTHGRRDAASPSVEVPLLLLALGALVASLHEAGALAYLAVPLWLARATARRRLLGLGLGTPVSAAAVGLGALTGVALGGHLLVAASLTHGYRPRMLAPAVLTDLAYDVGVQVIATECFFRGALFNRTQRFWPFAGAATLATIATLARYLIDPRLPGSAEILTGMVFYITLLSVMNCWLFWRFGSLIPCLVSSLLFFVAYRGIVG